MKALTLVLLCLGVGLALLIFNHGSGRTLGLDNEDFGRLIYLLPIAGLLAAGIIQGRREPIGQVVPSSPSGF